MLNLTAAIATALSSAIQHERYRSRFSAPREIPCTVTLLKEASGGETAKRGVRLLQIELRA